MMQISIYPFCGRITEIHKQRYHREDEHAENLWIWKLFSVGRYFLISTPILRIWSKSRIVYFTNILPARVWPEISSPAQFFACKPEYFVTKYILDCKPEYFVTKIFCLSTTFADECFCLQAEIFFQHFVCLRTATFGDEYCCL